MRYLCVSMCLQYMYLCVCVHVLRRLWPHLSQSVSLGSITTVVHADALVETQQGFSNFVPNVLQYRDNVLP